MKIYTLFTNKFAIHFTGASCGFMFGTDVDVEASGPVKRLVEGLDLQS